MKTLMQKFEDIMVAITFAEAGEFDVARKMVGGDEAPAAEEPAFDPSYETF